MTEPDSSTRSSLRLEPRSLIVEVSGAARSPSPQSRQVKVGAGALISWLFVLAGASLAIGYFVFDARTRAAASLPSDAVMEPATCGDVELAREDVRRTVDAFARTTEATSFQFSLSNGDPHTAADCRLLFNGEMQATWPSGDETSEAFGATAIPAANGAEGWIVDGPYFYDQHQDGVVQ